MKDDMIRHLRTVHFTIVALAFSLFVVSALRGRADAEIATDQIAEVRRIAEAWDPE